MPSSKPVRISGPAGRDLSNIAAYSHREWSRKQKEKYLGDIKSKFAERRYSPGIGTPRDDIAKGLRSHPLGGHVIFYRETKSALVIVRVLHQSMDLERHLERERSTGLLRQSNGKPEKCC